MTQTTTQIGTSETLTPESSVPRYVVMTAAAPMPGSCGRGNGSTGGTTERCAFRRALAEAKAMAAELNRESESQN